MKIQSGSVYVANNPSHVYGVIIRRVWWKPWRWQVTPILLVPGQGPGGFGWIEYGETTKNLTLLAAVGMAKLLGVEHKDFDDGLR